MIEGMEIYLKMSLESMMSDFDLVLFSRKFEKEKIFHITVEYGEVVTNEFLSVDAFRKDQWIDDDLDEHIEFAEESDPVFKVIKETYQDVQRVAFMYH